MTATKLQSILTGLKSEIRRETDRERRVNLAVMGLYYNRLLMYGDDKKYCPRCGEMLPLKFFELKLTKYRRKDHRIKFYLMRRPECKGCYNKEQYARRKLKKMKGSNFDLDFHC